MTWFTAVMVYLVVWWVVIFAVLPWGVRPRENPEVGHERGAPERPMLWRKAAVTSLIAAVIWVIVYLLVSNDAVDFYPK